MKNNSYSKMVAILALVLVTATSLLFALPATPSYAQGGYGFTGGGGGGGLPPQYSYIAGNTDQYGVLTSDTTARSYDELCSLTLNEGTQCLKRTGDPLSSILIAEASVPPTKPKNAEFVGTVYDCRPDGATFDPPIIITVEYQNPHEIPEGASEENLVIAYWDGTSWVDLEGPFTIDIEENTISAEISHFTEFAVIAYTNPAAFTTSSLTISPTVIDTGQDITIGVTVTNTGDLAGSHEVVLKINDTVTDTKTVTLDGRSSQEVSFTTTQDIAGSYTVEVNGLSGTFTVKAPELPPPAPAPTPAPEPAPAPAPTPAPAPAPPAPAPTPAPAPAPPAPAPAPPVTPVNWWLIGGIIAAVIIIAVVVWLVVARRRYA